MEIFDEIPERAMVVFAHPDDAELGAGGTSATWARAGCEISYVQCTSGSSGSNDPSMTSTDVVPIRAAEQRAAADVIGVKNLVVLDHPDGELEADRTFLGEVVRAIREHRPNVVLCHDPHRFSGFNHRDHRSVGITVMDAIYPYARDHLHFPESHQGWTGTAQGEPPSVLGRRFEEYRGRRIQRDGCPNRSPGPT